MEHGWNTDFEQKGTREAKERREIAEAQWLLLRNGQPIVVWTDAISLEARSGWYVAYPISE